VLEGPPFAGAEGAADAAAAWPGLAPWPLVVLVDDAAEATRSTELFLWTTFTRMEPAADMHGRRSTGRFHTGIEGPLVIDSRMKPTYPEVLAVDAATRDLVDRRWGDYGIRL
jgi:3-polyprenyl-4-hydroxybenzoate decarboxylase